MRKKKLFKLLAVFGSASILTLSITINSLAATYFNQGARGENDIGYWEGNTKTYNLGTGEYLYAPVSGCGPTAMAMVLNDQVSSDITPKDTIEYVLRNGLYRKSDGGSSFNLAPAMAKAYGLDYATAKGACGANNKKAQLAWIENELAAGHWLVVNVGTNYALKGGTPKVFFNQGHYVAFYGLDSAGNAICYDPGDFQKYKLSVPIEVVWGDSRSDYVNGNSIVSIWNNGAGRIYEKPTTDTRIMYAKEEEVKNTFDNIDKLLDLAASLQ